MKCGITFLSNLNGCTTGIALKRSSFSTTLEFLESILFADHFHDFVFIDYEGKDKLLTPEELDVLLGQIKNHMIITISARSPEFHQTRKYLIENYLRLTRSKSNISFCIVAGNPAYPSVDPRIPVNKAFQYVLARIQKKTSIPIFLGIENLSTNLIRQIICQYDNIIPFILHGDPRAVNSDAIPVPFAVYTPLTYTIPNNEAIKFLSEYLLRRKLTQRKLLKKALFPVIRPYKWQELSPGVKKILYESFDNYILTSDNFESRVTDFIRTGARLIVGNPAVPGQIYQIIKNFPIKLLQNTIYPENKKFKLN